MTHGICSALWQLETVDFLNDGASTRKVLGRVEKVLLVAVNTMRDKLAHQGSYLRVLILLFTYLLSKLCVCLATAWQEVEQKLEGGASGDSLSQGPIQYTEKTPSTTMKSRCPRFGLGHQPLNFTGKSQPFLVALIGVRVKSCFPTLDWFGQCLNMAGPDKPAVAAAVSVHPSIHPLYLCTSPLIWNKILILNSFLKYLLNSSLLIPDTLCADFVPIDLEEWWAQRFLANIANLSWPASSQDRKRHSPAPSVQALSGWGRSTCIISSVQTAVKHLESNLMPCASHLAEGLRPNSSDVAIVTGLWCHGADWTLCCSRGSLWIEAPPFACVRPQVCSSWVVFFK